MVEHIKQENTVVVGAGSILFLLLDGHWYLCPESLMAGRLAHLAKAGQRRWKGDLFCCCWQAAAEQVHSSTFAGLTYRAVTTTQQSTVWLGWWADIVCCPCVHSVFWTCGSVRVDETWNERKGTIVPWESIRASVCLQGEEVVGGTFSVEFDTVLLRSGLYDFRRVCLLLSRLFGNCFSHTWSLTTQVWDQLFAQDAWLLVFVKQNMSAAVCTKLDRSMINLQEFLEFFLYSFVHGEFRVRLWGLALCSHFFIMVRLLCSVWLKGFPHRFHFQLSVGVKSVNSVCPGLLIDI